MDSDEEQLLSPKDKTEQHSKDDAYTAKRSSSQPWLLLHLLAILFYTATSIFWIRTYSCDCAVPVTGIKPVSIVYKPQTFTTNITDSPFAGPPVIAIDQSWHDLLDNISIRVTKEELAQNHQTSIALPENGGYLAWLGVYHELHCIKMLRQWNYWDHYFPNLTRKEELHQASHADHCFELLRQAAMCHTDTSLATFEWKESKGKPVLNTMQTPHSCVDWDTLTASIQDRTVSRDEMAGLVNPMLVNSS